jgi:hypothetical protein
MLKKSMKKLLSFAASLLVVGLMFAEPANAETIFQRVTTITSNLGSLKSLLIYAFFLAGLGGIGWAGMDMLKKSKDRGGDDVSWSGIAIKFIAGAVLVGLTVTTDTMTETFLGTTTTSTPNLM